MRDLQGKVGLVTGASRGLGQACCELVAREGGKVIVADVDAKGADETVRLVKQAGGEATFVRTDVSQSRDVQTMVQAAIDTYGRLDFAVNNAMIPPPFVGLAELTEEDWDRTMAVNLDYAERNIRVNAVGPGTMVTPSMRKALDENPRHKAFLESLAPIKRFSDPHEVAEAVIWLCSDKASFVVGHTLVADGGACAGKLLKPA